MIIFSPIHEAYAGIFTEPIWHEALPESTIKVAITEQYVGQTWTLSAKDMIKFPDIPDGEMTSRYGYKWTCASDLASKSEKELDPRRSCRPAWVLTFLIYLFFFHEMFYPRKGLRSKE